MFRFGFKLMLYVILVSIICIFVVSCDNNVQEEISSGVSSDVEESETETQTETEAETDLPIVEGISMTYSFSGEDFDETLYEGVSGDTIVLPSSDYFEFGTVFKGWNDGSEIYLPGAEYILPDKNVIFTAVREEGGSKLILESCEDNTGWWGVIDGKNSISKDKNNFVEGDTSLSTYSTFFDAMNKDCSVMCVKWGEDFDISAFEDGYIHISVYLNDPYNVCWNIPGLVVFELNSYNDETMQNNTVLWCDYKDAEFKEGWNDFWYPVSDALKNASSLNNHSTDLTGIDSMRFFAYTYREATFNIDNIYLWNDSISANITYDSAVDGIDSITSIAKSGEEIALPEQMFYPMHREFVGWSDGEKTYAPGESFYVPFDGELTLTAIWNEDEKYTVDFDLDGGKGNTPEPITDFAKEYFYITDSIYEKEEYVFGGWTDGDKIYPSGTIYTFGNKNVTLKAVWNDLEREDDLIESFKLNSGGVENTLIINNASGRAEAVTKYVSWLPSETFGYVADFSCPGSFLNIPNSKIDLNDDFAVSMYFKAPKKDISADRTLISISDSVIEMGYSDRITLIEIERPTDLNIGSPDNRPRKSDDNPAEGKGACIFEADIAGSVGTVAISKNLDKTDLANYSENGVLHLWVYIEDTVGLINSQVEITSSGRGDMQENSWDIQSNLQAGWNELVLDIANSSVVDGGADFSKIDFFRIYFNFDAKETVSYKVGLDTIEIMNKPSANASDMKVSLNDQGKISLSGLIVDNSITGKTNVNDGKWHDILISREDDNLSILVDGNLDIKSSVSNNRQMSQSIFVGADVDGINSFMGSVSNLKIYSDNKEYGDISKTIFLSSDNTVDQTSMYFKKSIESPLRKSTQSWGNGQAEVFAGFENYRGLSDEDLQNIKRIGFDTVKMGINPENLINDDGSLNITNMQYIEHDLNSIIENGMNAIFCPHPQTEFKVKYLGNLDNFELLLKWYGELAEYIEKRWSSDELALQLMTEPNSNNSSVSWTYMTDREIQAVRNQNTNLTIIACSDKSGNIEHLKQMIPVTDDNVVYTFTTYEPYIVGWSNSYTGQLGSISVYSYLKDLPYPLVEGVDYTDAIEEAISMEPEELKAEARKLLWDYVNGKTGVAVYVDYGHPFNYEWHLARAKSLHDWSEANGGGIHLFVSEFGVWDRYRGEGYGAPKGTGLENSTRLALIEDFVKSFEEYGIAWNYWGYCGAFTIFDPHANTYRLPNYGISSKEFEKYVDRDLLEIFGLNADF